MIQHFHICNIRLLDAENLYFMRVPEFILMNTRTSFSAVQMLKIQHLYGFLYFR